MDSRGQKAWRADALLLLAIFVAMVQAGWHGPSVAAGQEQASASEVTSKEATPSFKIQVERNVVQVRVVVRDSKGRVVGGLQKENFKLLDNGKPQSISHFSAETPAPKPTIVAQTQPQKEDEETDEASPGAVPERFLGLFFDDVHMAQEDVIRTREAAERFLANSLLPSDRVAIFTSSGQNQLDFTDDRGKLHEALRALFPRPIMAPAGNECPEISDYQGYLILNRREPYAIEIAIQEAATCNPAVEALSLNRDVTVNQLRSVAEGVATSGAAQAVNMFQTRTEYALRSLDGLMRRMGGLPGQRTIVLVSPGFLMLTAENRVNGIVDRALKSNVIINTLDAKGLYAHIPLADATRNPVIPSNSAQLVGKKSQFDMERINVYADVLRSLAYDTGGVFFHNSNDLDDGFRKVAAVPEAYYVLAFTPENLKYDGKFHKLKVSISAQEKYAVQARNGYYAPDKPADPATQAKEEVEQAIFSHEELQELTVGVNTQFFKVSDTLAKLSILTHLDLQLVQFRKENGRNLNDLIFVTALFDRDGKYVTGKEKKVEFRLLDGTLAKLVQSGITSKASFEVPPGTYLVRQVVRDSEGALISALSRTVEIPL